MPFPLDPHAPGGAARPTAATPATDGPAPAAGARPEPTPAPEPAPASEPAQHAAADPLPGAWHDAPAPKRRSPRRIWWILGGGVALIAVLAIAGVLTVSVSGDVTGLGDGSSDQPARPLTDVSARQNPVTGVTEILGPDGQPVDAAGSDDSAATAQTPTTDLTVAKAQGAAVLAGRAMLHCLRTVGDFQFRKCDTAGELGLASRDVQTIGTLGQIDSDWPDHIVVHAEAHKELVLVLARDGVAYGFRINDDDRLAPICFSNDDACEQVPTADRWINDQANARAVLRGA